MGVFLMKQDYLIFEYNKKCLIIQNLMIYNLIEINDFD